MGYDLRALDPKADPDFHFNTFSWSPLLEACGFLFPVVLRGGQWYAVFGVDPRMGTDYPLLISNDGFKVTAEEAKTMARCARNFVLIQRSLPKENASKALIDQPGGIDRPLLMEGLLATMSGRPMNEVWPVAIREDFVDKYERFAEWAEKSGGFEVW